MNDVILNNITMTHIQINTKFLNHFQQEWKRYVTIVKHTKDLHMVNYDQLYDYLNQNQDEANEVRAVRTARNHVPLALIAYAYNTQQLSPHITQASYYNQQKPHIPQQSYALAVQQQSHVPPTLSSNCISQAPELETPTFDVNENPVEISTKQRCS